LIAQASAPGIFGAEVEDLGQILPTCLEEDIYVANSVATRRREFALGRFCARAALARMGKRDAAMARGPDGAPVWPVSVVGSITHTKGYAAAIVGGSDHFAGMGVDAERIGGVTEQLYPKLFDCEERAILAAMDEGRRRLVSTIFFSAKEAYFKAWRPLNGKPLSFRTIHIALDGDRFHANENQGHVAVADGLVLTAIVLPRC
jgi:4'-phosphopantetheinyl transferase EntD